jgi:hypothetical protein
VRCLPCDNCRTHAQLADGTPYLIGQTPVTPFRVSCSRCKLTSIITAARFASLPEVTHDELAGWGLLETYAADLTLGHALPIAHAVDLLKAGFTVQEVTALPVQEPPPEPPPEVPPDLA